MKSLRYFLIVFSLLFANLLLAQNETIQQKEKSVYNLPPGAVLKTKARFIDLSYKLSGKKSGESYTQEDLKFLKDIPESDIEKYKTASPEYYQYYITGRTFINSLSPKVKSIYSDSELWYIYAFDQKLKNKLTIIK